MSWYGVVGVICVWFVCVCGGAGGFITGSRCGVVTAVVDWVGTELPATPAPPPVPPPAPAGPWACGACTFINDDGAACSMCGTPNPAAPPTPPAAATAGTVLKSVVLHMDLDAAVILVDTLRGRMHHRVPFLFDNGHQRDDGRQRRVGLVSDECSMEQYARLGVSPGGACATRPVVRTKDDDVEVYIPQAHSLAAAAIVEREVDHPDVTLPLDIDFADLVSHLRLVVEEEPAVRVASLP